MRKHIGLVIFLSALCGSPAIALSTSKPNSVACYLVTDQQDWGALKFGAADSYIGAAEACHPGDTLYVDKLPHHQVNYLVASICDFRFAISTVRMTDNWSNVACVYAGERRARQD